jgi:hypothetical protein
MKLIWKPSNTKLPTFGRNHTCGNLRYILSEVIGTPKKKWRLEITKHHDISSCDPHNEETYRDEIRDNDSENKLIRFYDDTS